MSEEQKQLRRDYARNNPSGFMVYTDPAKVKAATQRRVIHYATTTSFDDLGWDTKRKTVLKEQNKACGKCGNARIVILKPQHLGARIKINRLRGRRYQILT